MPPEEIYSAVHRMPFEPFRMHISDGATFDIHHPDMLLARLRAIVIGLPGEPGKPHERFVTVALSHVTRLEPLRSRPREGGFHRIESGAKIVRPPSTGRLTPV